MYAYICGGRILQQPRSTVLYIPYYRSQVGDITIFVKLACLLYLFALYYNTVVIKFSLFVVLDRQHSHIGNDSKQARKQHLY